MKTLLAALLLLPSLASFAGGDKTGNGGDVIVCPGEPTQLLDLFQGKEDWELAALNRVGTREEIIKNTLADFLRVDPTVGGSLKTRSLEIASEIRKIEKGIDSNLVKLTKNQLVNISDEGVAELPAGCEIIQAATQVQKPFPKEVKFTFQRDLWRKLDEGTKAALILHEVIYEHMIAQGEYSSRSTRYFNAALHAGALTTVKDYFDVSALFEFKNLALVQDAPVRAFGAKKKCTIKYDFFHDSNMSRGGTTIMIGWKNIVTNEREHQAALNTFWEKYTSQGACD